MLILRGWVQVGTAYTCPQAPRPSNLWQSAASSQEGKESQPSLPPSGHTSGCDFPFWFAGGTACPWQSALSAHTCQRGSPDKRRTKLCFCPFCQYSVRNNQSFLNHMMQIHYQAKYGCGKCLGEVCSKCQLMQHHLSECEGLPDAAKSDSLHCKKASSTTKKAAHKQPQPKTYRVHSSRRHTWHVLQGCA